MIGIDLLSTDLKQITFEDVVEFCGRKEKEGIQFDYKKELSSIAKDFAAFSNTRGGVILIGVDEHKEFGYPIAWDGVDNDKGLLEKIDQWATTVQPIPRYITHMTNDVNGKVFILVKILEGDKTPYYVNNDSHLWVRTGIISNPIEMAKPDYVELLYNKRRGAEKMRELNIEMADDIFDGYLRKAERERQSRIIEEKISYDKKYKEDNSIGPFKQNTFDKKVGDDSSILKIVIQPFYPSTELMKPSDILDNVLEIRDGDGVFDINFPSVYLEKNPIPDGIAGFNWRNRTGDIHCEQLFSNGLVFFAWDLLTVERETGEKYIYLAHIVSFLFNVLKGASNYYKKSGFCGSLRGLIKIDDVENVKIKQEITSGAFSFYDDFDGLLNMYKFDFDLDTNVLFNDGMFQTYFIDFVKKIYWSFGYKVRDELVEIFLENHKWFVKKNVI